MLHYGNIKEKEIQPGLSVTIQSNAGKSGIQLSDNRPGTIRQKKLQDAIAAKTSIQKKENKTGLPDNLKSGIENLSGHTMDDVKVHYNSSQPAQFNAHAYAQGTDIHIAPGQEKHLPHEAWHVVQQKQGRVKPTLQLRGNVNVNDDSGLEKEADVMEGKVSAITAHSGINSSVQEMDHQNSSTRPIETESSSSKVFQLMKVVGVSSSGDVICMFTMYEEHPDADGNYKGDGYHYTFVKEENWRVFYSRKPKISVKEKPNSISTARRTDKKGEASPFQVLATQFEGKYDISMFSEQITSYILKQLGDNKIPVIELRMYDGIPGVIAEENLRKSQELIQELVPGSEFIVRISWLRDEARNPQKTDGAQSEEMHKEFIQTVKSFSAYYKPGRDNISLVARYLESKIPGSGEATIESGGKLFTSIGDPLDAIFMGRIMLPIPEAYKFYEESDQKLLDIISGKWSIHEKAVAFLVLAGRAKNLKIVGGRMTHGDAPTKQGRRQRSNSRVKPEEVAVANLVMGSEEESADLVIKVVENAFIKGAGVVHLIVEDKGMGKASDEGYQKRIDRQIRKLKDQGYEISGQKEIKSYVPSEKQPAAEQSGVRLQEPLLHGQTRDRWRLTIRKGNAIIHPLSFHSWKRFRGYYDDSLDEVYEEEYREYLNHVGMYQDRIK